MVAEEHRRLPADLAVHRAGMALVRGDVGQTVEHARRALEDLFWTEGLLRNFVPLPVEGADDPTR